MAKLIKIGERIINLDSLVYAQRFKKNGKETVIIQVAGIKTVPRNSPIQINDTYPLRMRFVDQNAEYVWKKLCEAVEVWALPGVIEPDADGSWPDPD